MFPRSNILSNSPIYNFKASVSIFLETLESIRQTRFNSVFLKRRVFKIRSGGGISGKIFHISKLMSRRAIVVSTRFGAPIRTCFLRSSWKLTKLNRREVCLSRCLRRVATIANSEQPMIPDRIDAEITTRSLL